MAILVDWVKQTVSGTPGTGAITLSTAVSGFIRFQDDTRISDGSVAYYTIEDGANRERGIGTYSTTGPTLTRTAIHAKIESGTYSENPGTGLNLSSSAIVSCSAIADLHNFIGVKISHSATQLISNISAIALNFDSEVFDTHGFHSNVTNNSRITIPSLLPSGKCILTFGIEYASNSTGARGAYVVKNGTSTLLSPFIPAVNGVNTRLVASTGKIDFLSGDYFELKAYQSSGGNLNVNSGVTPEFHFLELRVIK